MPEQLKGRAQTALIGQEGRAPVRTPLGFWSGEWDQFREEPWHGPLYSAFKNSMSALQRHEAADTQAAMVARTLDAAKQSTRVRIAPFLPPVEPEPKPVTTPWVA